MSSSPPGQPQIQKPGISRVAVALLVLIGLLIIGIMIGELTGGRDWLGRELASLSNTSYFTSEQMTQGVESARRSQFLVNAIEAYRRDTGRFPDKLDQLLPGWLVQSVDPMRYHYYVKDSGGYSLNGYEPGHTFMLYYESEVGWLMAEDPDTRPITLGFSP